MDGSTTTVATIRTTAATITAAPAGVYWNGGISVVQQDVLFTLFGTSGAISVFGASFLCYLIWNSTKSHILSSPRQRILFGLSFFDFVGSVRNCITGYRNIFHKMTEPSPLCTLNGFINFISYSAAFYNMFLSLFYYMTIRGGISQTTFALKYEKWGHAVAILFPLILGLVGLPFRIYNPEGDLRPGCLATAHPYTCTARADIECTRGEHAMIFLTCILGTIFFIGLPFIAVTNILIYSHVRKLDLRSRRFNYTDDRAAKTRRVATQCFLYVFVFFLSWIWTLINILIEFNDTANFQAGKYYGTLVLGNFFYPLQGFGNLVVYLRPVYLHLRGSGCTKWETFAHILLNKPIQAHGQPRANLGTISATVEDQRSQALSGHFRRFSRRLSSRPSFRDKTANNKMDHTVEGTEELTRHVSL